MNFYEERRLLDDVEDILKKITTIMTVFEIDPNFAESVKREKLRYKVRHCHNNKQKGKRYSRTRPYKKYIK